MGKLIFSVWYLQENMMFWAWCFEENWCFSRDNLTRKHIVLSTRFWSKRDVFSYILEEKCDVLKVVFLRKMLFSVWYFAKILMSLAKYFERKRDVFRVIFWKNAIFSSCIFEEQVMFFLCYFVKDFDILIFIWRKHNIFSMIFGRKCNIFSMIFWRCMMFWELCF